MKLALREEGIERARLAKEAERMARRRAKQAEEDLKREAKARELEERKRRKEEEREERRRQQREAPTEAQREKWRLAAARKGFAPGLRVEAPLLNGGSEGQSDAPCQPAASCPHEIPHRCTPSAHTALCPTPLVIPCHTVA